jgi:hypothetical protein
LHNWVSRYENQSWLDPAERSASQSNWWQLTTHFYQDAREIIYIPLCGVSKSCLVSLMSNS